MVDIGTNMPTPVQCLGEFCSNAIWIKREDLIPFCFGGNKARKAQLFFKEFDRDGYDCVVTYGSSSSNHCRVIANMAAGRNVPCYIISPEEAYEKTYNSDLMFCFGAEITTCPVCRVSDVIYKKLAELEGEGQKPYFIAGGGHGNLGTQAYMDCYEEIRHFERENNVRFDYIFHASGTGTTQAGLICGQLMNNDDRKIVGISIARTNPRGRSVVLESVKDYLQACNVGVEDSAVENATVFVDRYVGGGYGKSMPAVDDIIGKMMLQHGIPLDPTYTGKAFSGMIDMIETTGIKNKNILFIHTGGTPLYFDFLNKTSSR